MPELHHYWTKYHSHWPWDFYLNIFLWRRQDEIHISHVFNKSLASYGLESCLIEQYHFIKIMREKHKPTQYTAFQNQSGIISFSTTVLHRPVLLLSLTTLHFLFGAKRFIREGITYYAASSILKRDCLTIALYYLVIVMWVHLV